MKFVFRFCILIGAASAILCMSSCKKDNTPAVPLPEIPSANEYKALFDSRLMYAISGSTSYSFSSGSENHAGIYNKYFSNFMDPTGQLQPAGNISLNNVTFKNARSFYTDSTGNFQPVPNVWKSIGGLVPAFSFTNTNAYPVFTGFTSWPDTIIKSQNLTLNLNGFSGADEIRFYIFSDNATSSRILGAGPASSTSTYAIWPSAVLSALTTGEAATIQLEVYKNNIQTVNGERYNFRTTSVYMKTVGVKN